MKRLISFILLIVYLNLSCAQSIYPDYIQKELDKKGEKFKNRLSKCNKLISELTKRQIQGKETEKIDKKLKEFNCEQILKEYEEIFKKAAKKAQLEKKKRWEKFERNYTKLLKKAKLFQKEIKVYPFKFENYKYLFLLLPINSSKYEILEVEGNIPLPFKPRCDLKSGYMLYLPVLENKKNIRISVYFADKNWAEKIFREISNLNKPFRFKETQIYKLEKNITVNEFKPFKPKIIKEKEGYLIKLPTPVMKAYADYIFVGEKKYFPSCSTPVIKVKELPDDICIRIDVLTNEGGVSYKDICITENQW